MPKTGLITAFLLIFPVLCHAFVPSGSSLVKTMSERLGCARTVQVRASAFKVYSGPGKRSLKFAQTVWFEFPGSILSRTVSAQAIRTYVRLNGEERVFIQPGLTIVSPHPFDRFWGILLNRTPRAVKDGLRMLGVDLNITSLGRMGKRTVYVIGSTYPEETRSQLWLDKKSFLPLRLVAFEGAKVKNKYEILFSDWEKTGGFRYPASIDLLRENKSVQQISVEKIILDLEYRPGFFYEKIPARIFEKGLETERAIGLKDSEAKPFEIMQNMYPK